MLLVQSRKAFSLIEISIVILIIGFLITTITAAITMVENSKVSAVSSEVRRWQTLGFTFKAKHDFMPGDYSGASSAFSVSTTYNGNGDGFIGDSSPLEQESVDFFYHLKLSGIIDASYTGAVPGSYAAVTIGTHYPNTKLGKDTFFYLKSDTLGTKFIKANRIAIGTKSSSGSLTPELAYKFDQKIDDGMPLTGKVIAADPSDMGFAGMIPQQKNQFNLINSAYATSSTTCVTEGDISDLSSRVEMRAATYNTSVNGNYCIVAVTNNNVKNQFNSALPEEEEEEEEEESGCGSLPSTSTYLVSSWTGSGTDDGDTISGSCSASPSTTIELICSTDTWNYNTDSSACNGTNPSCDATSSYPTGTVGKLQMIACEEGKYGPTGSYNAKYVICNSGGWSAETSYCEGTIADTTLVADGRSCAATGDGFTTSAIPAGMNYKYSYITCPEGYYGFMIKTCSYSSGSGTSSWGEVNCRCTSASDASDYENDDLCDSYTHYN